MTNLIEMKTAELTGEALNWSVAKALGMSAHLAEPQYGNPHRVMVRYTPDGCHFEQQKRYRPSTDWAQGGPLISESCIGLQLRTGELPENAWRGDHFFGWGEGPTALIAGCRAIVSAALGDTVSVPKELV